MEQRAVKQSRFKITIQRQVELELPGEDRETLRYDIVSQKDGKQEFGYVKVPPLAPRVIKESMVLLEQELDNLNFELVVRAINFPRDFGPLPEFVKEGQ